MTDSPTTPASARPPFALPAFSRSNVLVLAGVLLAGAALFWFDPTRYAIFPPCLFHRLTGWNCPGCGATRAMHALLHGHLLDALRDNLLLMAALPLVAFYGSRHVLAWSAGRPLPWPAFRPMPFVWVVAIMIIFTVVRNIPLAPFTLLSPAP